MQEFWRLGSHMDEMIRALEKSLLWDLLEAYPDFRYFDSSNLTRTLTDIFRKTNVPFVFVIDEWDCVFRESKADFEGQRIYLDFLRNLLKDREYSMTSPKQLAEYVGFTQAEVQELCRRYQMDFEEGKRWYDGYQFGEELQIYNPRSVVSAMLSRTYDNYWNQTETFEALRDYIVMNYDGLKDMVIELLAGGRKRIDTGTFSNDMTTFLCADDILTLLIHLGYLGYDFSAQEVFVPNSEVASEFIHAMRSAGWDEVIRAVSASEELLNATWSMDADRVATGIEYAHFETPILTYHDENSLSCTISLAYYSARRYYVMVREFPTGRGFADMVFLPRKGCFDKPAMIVELKWQKSVRGAIAQIKEKQYVQALEEYHGNLLLVGVNYNKNSKEHSCVIEKYQI